MSKKLAVVLAVNNVVLAWAVLALISDGELVNRRLEWLRGNYFGILQTARENDYLIHSLINFVNERIVPVIIELGN